jgi:hypothetical protein
LWFTPIILTVGSKDQEDRSSKPAQANSETVFQKRAGGVAQGIGAEFKPQYPSTTFKKKKGLQSGSSGKAPA